MFRSVVSEENLSKDLQSRCLEQGNIGERGEKKIARKVQNKDSEEFGIFKNKSSTLTVSE
jgi:hypothetical protein